MIGIGLYLVVDPTDPTAMLPRCLYDKAVDTTFLQRPRTSKTFQHDNATLVLSIFKVLGAMPFSFPILTTLHRPNHDHADLNATPIDSDLCQFVIVVETASLWNRGISYVAANTYRFALHRERMCEP